MMTKQNREDAMTTVKYFWNGLKVNGEKKLYRAHYSFVKEWTRCDTVIPTHLTIYARDYSGFPAELLEVFEIENDSDSMTDYFETDSITVHVDHPEFDAVYAAWAAQEEHEAQIKAKRTAKMEARVDI
jgi:hypothetical protein